MATWAQRHKTLDGLAHRQFHSIGWKFSQRTHVMKLNNISGNTVIGLMPATYLTTEFAVSVAIILLCTTAQRLAPGANLDRNGVQSSFYDRT